MAPTKGIYIRASKKGHRFIKALEALSRFIMPSKKACSIAGPSRLTRSNLTHEKTVNFFKLEETTDTKAAITAVRRTLLIPDILAQILEVIAKRWG